MPAKYSEKLFRQNFVKWFRGFYPKGHIQNIESEATSAGVADVNACKDGKEIWIELKSGRLTTASIKPGQYMWHTKRNQAGGTTWLIQRDEYGILKVFKGNRIKEFQVKPASVEPDIVFDSKDDVGRRLMFEYLFTNMNTSI